MRLLLTEVGSRTRPTVRIDRETGEIKEDCATASPMGETYFIELAFNADGRGAEEPPVMSGKDVERAWTGGRWWAKPVEFTAFGPYEAYDPTKTPRNTREVKDEVNPDWNSYSVMARQYLTVRLWVQFDGRLSEHYDQDAMCGGAEPPRLS